MKLYGRYGKSVWQYTFGVDLDRAGSGLTYTIGQQTWPLHLPALPQLRIAFTSCNGEAQDTLLGAHDTQRNERWRHLADEHAADPFHLLIQGGDQLYADDVWREVPALAAWRQLDGHAQQLADWTPEMAEGAADFYFDRYCRLWSQPDLAPLLASIPSLMMWDDHDIFDGWGSHAPELQGCPVFQGLWTVAREFFALFQLGTASKALPDMFGDPDGRHFGHAVTLGEVGIIMADLRSERTPNRVMGGLGWAWLQQTLKQMASCQQVFLISSVPVVHLDWSAPERFLIHMQWFRHYHDDIRDQWRSHEHLDEWKRLVTTLLDFASRTRTRLTIVSGEIHLGALGLIERGDTRIYQLISSGIVHHSPPALAAALFSGWSRWPGVAPEATTVRLCPLPHRKTRFLAARNWLSLDYGQDASLEAVWHAEGQDCDIRLQV
ncbi:alkaline phosphatase D family protein [Candidatus Entotheonella palauensis]|uniref:alkaline phosphatase D family protein n=1 Tax=Candidatus Entotheonella palauensis TaxID=93172 RepID=UPI000B802C39|nr:alkaline phosphatase D family protein [Candidatus Entotheonella palauensis]